LAAEVIKIRDSSDSYRYSSSIATSAWMAATSTLGRGLTTDLDVAVYRAKEKFRTAAKEMLARDYARRGRFPHSRCRRNSATLWRYRTSLHCTTADDDFLWCREVEHARAGVGATPEV